MATGKEWKETRTLRRPRSPENCKRKEGDGAGRVPLPWSYKHLLPVLQRGHLPFLPLSSSHIHSVSRKRAPLGMGLTVSSLISSLTSLLHWSKEKDVRILMLGLDSAGKTTILYRLQVGGTLSLSAREADCNGNV